MKIALSQIPPDGLDVVFEVAAGRLSGAADGLLENDVIRVSCRVWNEAGDLRVRGQVETGLALECGRCLMGFPRFLDGGFDVVFRAVLEGGAELQLTEADLSVCHLEGDVLDLFGLAREQVLLTVPIAPLCREDCAGLCPHCGANLNDAPCPCNEPVDPRFSALKKWL